jgi:hypothetical protein
MSGRLGADNLAPEAMGGREAPEGDTARTAGGRGGGDGGSGLEIDGSEPTRAGAGVDDGGCARAGVSPDVGTTGLAGEGTSMTSPHLRHFMRTARPSSFSSAIWYFALHFGQRNLIEDYRATSRYVASFVAWVASVRASPAAAL